MQSSPLRPFLSPSILQQEKYSRCDLAGGHFGHGIEDRFAL
jgi:hypothetical protein